ncbi:MAG: hypothetical protein AAFZ15_27025 [Bacteroidota bacterium]
MRLSEKNLRNNSLHLFLLTLFLLTSCASEPPMQSNDLVESEKQIWVYTHSIRDGWDYTVFSPEKPINKGILPSNFLAIKNRKHENWSCLMKWENEVLWFYTPSTHSFASHNSENGKTQWTIIEEKDYNFFFHEDEDQNFIRFSSVCGQQDILCLDAEEMVIGE